MRRVVAGALLLLLGITAAPAHADAVDDVMNRVVTANNLAGGVAVVRVPQRDG